MHYRFATAAIGTLAATAALCAPTAQTQAAPTTTVKVNTVTFHKPAPEAPVATTATVNVTYSCPTGLKNTEIWLTTEQGPLSTPLARHAPPQPSTVRSPARGTRL